MKRLNTTSLKTGDKTLGTYLSPSRIVDQEGGAHAKEDDVKAACHYIQGCLAAHASGHACNGRPWAKYFPWSRRWKFLYVEEQYGEHFENSNIVERTVVPSQPRESLPASSAAPPPQPIHAPPVGPCKVASRYANPCSVPLLAPDDGRSIDKTPPSIPAPLAAAQAEHPPSPAKPVDEAAPESKKRRTAKPAPAPEVANKPAPVPEVAKPAPPLANTQVESCGNCVEFKMGRLVVPLLLCGVGIGFRV